MLIRLPAYVVLAFTGFITQAAAGQTAPVIELAILADGSLQVEGKTYSSRPAIAAEFDRLSKREPQPWARVRADKHATYADVAYIMSQIQRTGAVKLGIVNTAPR